MEEVVKPQEVNTDTLLSIEDILAADDTSFVTVNAWGGKIRFASLDAETMIKFTEELKTPAAKTAGIRMVVRSLVNNKGERIGTPAHFEAFGKKNAKVLNELGDIILDLNGMGKDRDTVNIIRPLKATRKDPAKIHALVEHLRELADSVEDIVVDGEVNEEKFKKMLEPPDTDLKTALKNA